MDIHEGITVKALLDNGAMGMFIDKRMVARHGLKLQRLKRPIVVRNVNETNNSGGVIIHQIEMTVYYKGHVERMRMDICDLGKTEIILGILWLTAHNPEINWETREIKITRCPPLCGERSQKKEKEKTKKEKRVATLEEEKIVRWAIDDKEDWGREKEIEENYRKIEKLVPRKFLK